ncbi:hypothetical protein BGZ60DRAFT_411062 [Tricladium varicosporioides]|nr:hypothetical protein BGZ60DRAFT_411062 [Hymenoscyphus varicosporioides]
MRRADESLGQTEEVRRRDADIRKYTEKISHPTTRTWEQGFWGFDNSAEEASDESAKVKEQEGKLLDATVNAKPYQQLYPESLNMEVWERHQQGNGSNIEGPTVPDSGIQQAKDKYDDIGILSLEDVLGSENGDTSQYSSFLPSSRGKRKEIEVTNKQHRKYSQEGDEKTTDEHTAYHLTAMQNYTNTPAPKVQQVGFTTTNCIRGKEYRVRAAERASRQHISEVRETSMLPLNPGAFKIWDSEEQKEIVIDQQVRGAGKGGLRFPDMFRHGLMYLPEGDGVGSKRTVVVGNLPRDIELWELFRKVRGGMVVSAVLVDSIALTGAKSALVQFVSGFDAKRYIEFVSEHPLFFGDEDEKVKTSFTLINTPTWPIGPGLAKAIFDIDLKYTRCLIVPCFPPNLSLTTLEATLRGSKGVHHDSLVDMYFDRKRNLHLEFSSVVAAGRARGLLGAWFRYRSLTIENEADPCAGELEELLIEFMPRRPLFPHEGFLDWAMEEDFPFAINTRQIDAPFADSSYVHRMDIVDLQGKRMAALDNQTVKIPSFSGKGSSSSNWADEVNEEPPPPSDTKISPFSILHPQEVPPNTPIPIRQVVDMIMADNINEKMKEVALVGGIRANFRKPPVGLAASKYVCLVPGFGDKRRDRSRTTEVKEFFIERKMVGSQAKEMRGAQNPDEIELDPE